MTGKQARQIKSRWQFGLGVTLAAVVCVASGWVVLQRLTTSAIDPSSMEPLTSPSSDPKAVDRPTPSPSTSTIPTPTVTRSVPPLSANQQTTSTPLSKAVLRQGVFRVGNPTSYPVRVALLSKKAVEAGTTPVGKPRYEPPAHWDFSPEEGGAQGLLVSLPDRTLKLKTGDVLVAFAQDGSGRYWGPYVVDETALPLWNAKAAEWQLILSP